MCWRLSLQHREGDRRGEKRESLRRTKLQDTGNREKKRKGIFIPKTKKTEQIPAMGPQTPS